jgi:hypothetical protein
VSTQTTGQLWAQLEGGLRLATDLTGDSLDEFLESLEEGVAELTRITNELKSSFHVCPMLQDRLSTPQGQRDFLAQIESDQQRREKTRQKIIRLRENVVESDELLALTAFVVAERHRVSGVTNTERQKTARSQLEKIAALETELKDWSKSARRGLEDITGTPVPAALEVVEILAEFCLAKPKPPKRSEAETRADSSAESTAPPMSTAPSASTTPAPASPGPVSAASKKAPEVSSGGDAAILATPPRKGPNHTILGVRSSDAEVAWNGLRRLARRSLRVRSDLPDRVQIRRSREAFAKLLRVRRLIVSRRVVRGMLDGGKLWDVPIDVPIEFVASTTMRGTLDDAVVEALYESDEHTEFFCDSAIDRELITMADGKAAVQRSIDCALDPRRRNERVEKCLDIVSAHLGPKAYDSVANFVKRPRDESSSRAGTERIVRLEFEMVVVPVREMVCGSRDAASSVPDFTIWIYGQDGKFAARGYPKQLTSKLVASALGGAAVVAGLAYLALQLFGA